ncbi:MAG: signal recognition particle-docking protein FtsY [Methylococcales symbiont of Iophon sp. n. MRB-2018]|nr:MAG: signal recognition particle-docking protein FtsY [Methylococcales symbiont of Iophon sp. n. MRB-2018]KAF3978955.1 MAG: signal recognition particle-docking protein FtsY [Methylococcales symbiont of Iophon sp. n. MRB-2018]
MFRKITLITLIIALLVVFWGSIVQVSNSGSACPDWPGCFGKALVFDDVEFRVQAAADFPQTRFNITKAWTKIIHRYTAAILGLLVIILAFAAWKQKHCRCAVVTSTLLLLLLIAFYLVLDKFAIDLNAMPIVVTAQSFTGFFVFWLLYRLYLRGQSNIFLHQQKNHSIPRVLANIAIVVLCIQVFLGIWTSENNATLACTDFPRCNNQWIPTVDYLNALDIFAGLEKNYAGVLSFDGQVAIHWMHRAGAVFSFILLTLLILSATSEQYSRPVRKAGLLLSILLMIQISLGVMTIRFGAPIGLTIVHNILAALLMLPVISMSFYSKYAFIDGLNEGQEQLDDKDSYATKESVVEIEVEEEIYRQPSAESLYLRLKTQLQKTRTGLAGVLSNISLAPKGIDDDLLEQIESSLLMADIGIDTTTQIIATLTERLEKDQLNDGEALEIVLKESLLEILQPCCQPLEIPQQETPFVILVVGINGVGKTTTIGKLAKRLQIQGHSVMLAAGDTFRAAAVEQLEAWGESNNIQVIAQQTGADSASVIFDAVQSAKAKNIDVLIADTAGRLHTKANLMEELSKIKRIMGKVDEAAPHEVLLVLDAGTGQNALSQTKIFNASVELTALALTKLDGTAKGGVIFALARQFGLPIRFIGVGEGIDDLQDFNADAFVNALFVKD